MRTQRYRAGLALAAGTLGLCLAGCSSEDRPSGAARPPASAAQTEARIAASRFDGSYYGNRTGNVPACPQAAPQRATLRVIDGRATLRTLTFDPGDRGLSADVEPDGSVHNATGSISGQISGNRFEGRSTPGGPCRFTYSLTKG